MSFPHSPLQRGFSLVETALALGIVSFALIAVVGLLPFGLNHFREAIDATVGAQISQRVISEAQQAEFDGLIKSAALTTPDFFVLPLRYFDEQGNEVASTAVEAVYQVRVRGSQPGPGEVDGTGGGTFTSLPAAVDAERFRPRDSIFLTVQVVNRPPNVVLAVDARQLWLSKLAPIGTYTTVIARNGYTPVKP